MLIKKNYISLILVIFAASFYAQAQNQKANTIKDLETEYKQLVEKAKKNSTDVDFVRFRAVYFELIVNESKVLEAPNREAMVEAFEKQDFKKGVELAEVVLDYEFGNRGLHLAVEDAYRKIGDTEKADFHRDIAKKIMDGILKSADGKTQKTAYKVLSIREEYIIMRELGYEVEMQALLSGEDGQMFDLLSGKDKKTGKAVNIYFNICSFFGCETKPKN